MPGFFHCAVPRLGALRSVLSCAPCARIAGRARSYVSRKHGFS
ncbi:hypothetical protein PCLA_11f0095 [Pseudomonas citronellolis]|nr:hypothetical protein PCLA_11f0095 [Pseudomonas citronellolis]